MEARKSVLPYLPDDLIIEILLRSSVKSVGRFRCLSKLFCSLLSDPMFARNQLELTLRRRSNRSDNSRLFMFSSFKKLLLVDLDSMDVEREYSVKEDLILLSKRTDIIGSSNGLVCVKCLHMDKEGEVLLYNPITRDSKIIPMLPESLHCKPHHQLSFRDRYGFGFDALTNDYKVMMLISCEENEHNKHTVCYVYSLKTDSWRRINHQLPYYTLLYVSSANLKGAIHWSATITKGVEYQNVIMAFDLEKEELREMPLPKMAFDLDEFDLGLRYSQVDTLKGCLCMVHGFYDMHKSIWVMKEYGVESSWSKIGINVSEYSIKPLRRNKNDNELLLVFDGNFVYKKVKTPDEKCYIKVKLSMYVESFISPNSYAEQRLLNY